MRPSRRQMQPFIRRWSGAKASATVLLVAILGGSYASQWILETFQPEHLADPDWLRDWLALGTASATGGKWWQFVTFGLLHANPLHLIGNLLLIYFAGREVEPIVGSRQTTAMFLLGNFVGGVVHAIAMPDQLLMGATAGAAALLVAYATTLPELEVVGHLFFVVPVKAKAKYFGLGVTTLSAVCWFSGALPSIGPAAVFAGSVVGWVYARQLGFGNPFWFQRIIFERRQREARLARMPAEQFLTEEVDPILEKIAAQGIGSLSRAERQILERGRSKIVEKAGAR